MESTKCPEEIQTNLLLSVLNSSIDQLCVFGLFCSSQDEGGVRGSILWLVLFNGSKVAWLLIRLGIL